MLGIYGMLSSKGDCWDNAVAESLFGRLKTERVFLTEYDIRKAACRDIVDYIFTTAVGGIRIWSLSATENLRRCINRKNRKGLNNRSIFS